MKTNGKPRGKPFQPGADDRRHLAGSKNKEALDFKAEFKRVLHEEVNIKKLVRVLLRKAEAGIPWAMAEVLDRGLGKAVMFTDNKFENGVTYRIVYARETDPAYPGGARLAEGQGPSLDARLALEAADTLRLLEAGKVDEDAADASEDYIDACKKA